MDPQILSLGLAMLGAGALAGFAAGLFGIGGGAIMVPVLFFVFEALGYSPDITMKMALATSTSVIIVTSIRSARGHHLKGAVDWSLVWQKNPFKSWGLWIALGALLAGSWIVDWLSGRQLTLMFGVLAILLSLQFMFGRPDFRLGERVPGGAAPPFAGTVLGGICGLMGIGFGSIGVTLMLLFGKSIHRAIGTAAAIGFFIGLPAAIGYVISGWNIADRPPYSLGYVNVVGFATMALATIVCVPFGVKLAHKLSQERLRMVFGICLCLVAINMIRKAL